MTKPERERVARIRFDLSQKGIALDNRELELLARGATLILGELVLRYTTLLADSDFSFSSKREERNKLSCPNEKFDAAN